MSIVKTETAGETSFLLLEPDEGERPEENQELQRT